MAARRGCIPPISTTTPTPSARWISPATCRSSSGPTARALAASSVRWSSSRAISGRSASCAPATAIRFRAGAANLAPAGVANARARRSRASSRRWRRGPRSVYRRAGDAYLLVEFGPLALDLGLRMRVHLLHQALIEADACRRHRSDAGHPLTADPLRRRVLPLARLLDEVMQLEKNLPPVDEMEIAKPRRASAAVLERRAGRTRDAQISGVGAPRCALVPVQHRVHPPHQRARFNR